MHNCSYNYSNWMNTCVCVYVRTTDKVECYSLKPVLIYKLCSLQQLNTRMWHQTEETYLWTYYIQLVWFWTENGGESKCGYKIRSMALINKEHESGCILLCSTEFSKMNDDNKIIADLNIPQTHITLTSIKYLTAAFYRCCCCCCLHSPPHRPPSYTTIIRFYHFIPKAFESYVFVVIYLVNQKSWTSRIFFRYTHLPHNTVVRSTLNSSWMFELSELVGDDVEPRRNCMYMCDDTK